MLSSTAITPEQAWGEISTRKETTVTEASKNLIPLYSAIPFICQDDLKLAQTAYQGVGWKITLDKFKN